MLQSSARPFFRPPTEALRYLPECPTVLRSRDRLGWVAIQHGADAREGSLNVLDLRTLENRSYTLPGRPGFFVELDAGETLLIGLERRLVRFDLASGAVTDTLAQLPEDPRVIINDGIAIPGGVIFGTKHLEFNRPIASLYHYDLHTKEIRELAGGQTCSNGKYYHDGVLIDIDTQPKTITEYRYDGALHRRRLITPPENLPALPDGMRAAPGGESVIVAYYHPAHTPDGLAQQIRLLDGEVLAEWALPGSPRVTCPEFVEIDGVLHLLFTTAVEGMPEETRRIAPEAGTMFVAPWGETAL